MLRPHGHRLYASPCGNRAKWPSRRRTPLYGRIFPAVHRLFKLFHHFRNTIYYFLDWQKNQMRIRNNLLEIFFKPKWILSWRIKILNLLRYVYFEASFFQRSKQVFKRNLSHTFFHIRELKRRELRLKLSNCTSNCKWLILPMNHFRENRIRSQTRHQFL